MGVLLQNLSYGAVLEISDASCFSLLAEEFLEVVRGDCGGKVTVFDIDLDRVDGW